MTNYWQTETPIVATSAKNVLRWFPKAERLQVSLPDWVGGNGKTNPGKTVTLNVEALRESDDVEAAKRIFQEVLASLE